MSNRRSINLWGLIGLPPSESPTNKTLVGYFRGDGYSRFGFDGDERGLTPEECAVKWLREFDTFLKTWDGAAAYTRYLYTLTPAGKAEVEASRQARISRAILDQRPEWNEPPKSPYPCDTLWGSISAGRCPLCNWLKVDHK